VVFWGGILYLLFAIWWYLGGIWVVFGWNSVELYVGCEGEGGWRLKIKRLEIKRLVKGEWQVSKRVRRGLRGTCLSALQIGGMDASGKLRNASGVS
jgi:hypothetical protein